MPINSEQDISVTTSLLLALSVKSVPQGLTYLNTWPLVGVSVWGVVTEEVHRVGLALRVSGLVPLLVPLLCTCLQLRSQLPAPASLPACQEELSTKLHVFIYKLL